MIDFQEHRRCVTEAEQEAETGPEGERIASSMLKTLRGQFPTEWAMPWLDLMIIDPTSPRWPHVMDEVMAATNELVAAQTSELDRRKSQSKTAAKQPRTSKWTALRDRLDADLEVVWANGRVGDGATYAGLCKIWEGAGLKAPEFVTAKKWFPKN